MATTWRSSGIGIVFCMLASTCAWGSPGDWTRIATERSIAENSPDQREVLEWLHARAAPGLGSPGALRLGVTRVFPGQPELSEIGRAPVCTPVPNAHPVCRLLHEQTTRH